MGKYFSDIHASCESQFRGLPHGLADTPEIAACRAELENCFLISDKARCIAGSVLELIAAAYWN